MVLATLAEQLLPFNCCTSHGKAGPSSGCRQSSAEWTDAITHIRSLQNGAWIGMQPPFEPLER